MHHYLVVANQTLGNPQLIDTIVACRQAGPCCFHLLVPATQSQDDHTRWTRPEATAIARCRLDTALARLKRLGVPASGEVGDPSPTVAIGEALNRDAGFDSLILSTLPEGASQWLRRGVPQRIERLFHLPVRLVVCGATGREVNLPQAERAERAERATAEVGA
jgi:hypothetical protein